MRAQASAEFLIVIAIMSMAMLPLLLALQANATQTPDKLALAKATFSAARLSSAVMAVGSLGLNSSMMTAVEFPNVVLVNASGREILVRVATSYGPVDIVQPTRFNVTSPTGGLDAIRHEGSYVIDVRASAVLNDTNVTLTLR